MERGRTWDLYLQDFCCDYTGNIDSYLFWGINTKWLFSHMLCFLPWEKNSLNTAADLTTHCKDKSWCLDPVVSSYQLIYLKWGKGDRCIIQTGKKDEVQKCCCGKSQLWAPYTWSGSTQRSPVTDTHYKMAAWNAGLNLSLALAAPGLHQVS